MMIITAFLLGLFFLNFPREVKALTPPCQTLWWFDNTSLVCNQKSFCGSYMYQGLRTFTTKEECLKNLPTNNCSMKKCGDANCDGKIDVQDLLIWMKNRSGKGKSADFNNDGKTDSLDYEIIKNGMKKGCPVVTVIPKITQVPTITCEILHKINLNRSENYFKMCLDNGYPKVCFNKYSGIYQGCGTLERDDCTEFNMNADKNIRCDSNFGGGLTPTVTPTVTPIGLKNVEWSTQWASFVASNFQIKVADGTSQGRIFTVNPSKACNSLTGERICVHSNPPYLMDNGQYYMTLEVVWYENDIEMRMFVYLYSDGQRWWSNEIRVYNGQAQPNTEWVYFYGRFFDAPVGQSFKQSGQFLLNAADPKNGNSPVTLSFSNLEFKAFANFVFQKITPTPVGSCETDKDCAVGQICYQPPMPVCPSGVYCTQVMPRKYCKTVAVSPTPKVCKEGVNSFSVYTSCGEGKYRYATYSCYDGLSGKLGGNSACASAAEYSLQAQKMCLGHGNCPPTVVPSMECNMSINPPKLCPSGYKCIVKSGMPGSNGTCVRMVTTSVPTATVTCSRNGDADGDGVTTLKDFAIWKYEYSNSQAKKADFDCNKRVDLEDYQIWKKAFLLAKSLVVSLSN
ncbi:MAG TPA: dockerin type I repeat-containing protein [Candidatus Methanoperedens sp.]|nr:dockerin type I repeat-containing protein [Candidatus Methanoperedens sp.]